MKLKVNILTIIFLTAISLNVFSQNEKYIVINISKAELVGTSNAENYTSLIIDITLENNSSDTLKIKLQDLEQGYHFIIIKEKQERFIMEGKFFGMDQNIERNDHSIGLVDKITYVTIPTKSNLNLSFIFDLPLDKEYQLTSKSLDQYLNLHNYRYFLYSKLNKNDWKFFMELYSKTFISYSCNRINCFSFE